MEKDIRPKEENLMKKRQIGLLVSLCGLIVGIFILAYSIAFQRGAVHALENMELWAAQEWDIMWDADGNAWYHMNECSDYDGTIDIYYNGDWYIHSLYVG